MAALVAEGSLVFSSRCYVDFYSLRSCYARTRVRRKIIVDRVRLGCYPSYMSEEKVEGHFFWKLLGFVIAVPLVAALSAAIYIWQGWVLSSLWGWYLVPLGLVSVKAYQAAGIKLLWDVVRAKARSAGEKDPEVQTHFMVAVAWPLIAYIIGGGLHLWFG